MLHPGITSVCQYEWGAIEPAHPQRTPSKYVTQAFSFLNSYETDIADIDDKPKLIEEWDESSEYRIEAYVDHEEDVRRTTENGLERKVNDPESVALEDGKKSEDDRAIDVKDGSVLIRVSGVSSKSKAVIEEEDLTTGTSENKIKPKDMKTGTSEHRNVPSVARLFKINPVYEVTEDEHVDDERTEGGDGVENVANDSLKPSQDDNKDESAELEKDQPESVGKASSVEKTENADDDDDKLKNEACTVVKVEDANINITTEDAQNGNRLQYRTEDKDNREAIMVESEVVEMRNLYHQWTEFRGNQHGKSINM